MQRTCNEHATNMQRTCNEHATNMHRYVPSAFSNNPYDTNSMSNIQTFEKEAHELALKTELNIVLKFIIELQNRAIALRKEIGE
jgi:hypothetical protein